MSDDEYEYEYDDDEDNMQEDGGGFEYTDDEAEQDDGAVAVENAYYNAKGLRGSGSSEEVVAAFEEVLKLESPAAAWSFKALKQLIKWHLRTDPTQIPAYYRRLLEHCNSVSPNSMEKGVQNMLERLANVDAACDVYEATLRTFALDGTCPNERLWFKANLKYGQHLYERGEADKLEQVLRSLQARSEDHTSTQAVEILSLRIQWAYLNKDHKLLRATFDQAMAVRGSIPHPRTLARMQELGGKMYMGNKEYHDAVLTFFQAFKSYDEAGDSRRLQCLKYLVIASMLDASSINPFDSQEARPYKDDPDIVALTNLVQAFHANDIQTFERTLQKGKIGMDDAFIRAHMEDLLRTMRKQVLRRVVRPYQRISLAAISRQLNNIPVEYVETLLISLILNGSLEGQIDQAAGVLIKKREHGEDDEEAPKETKTEVEERCEILDDLITRVELLNSNSVYLPEREADRLPMSRRGMVLG